MNLYGTLGPSCCDEDNLYQMFRAGMTGIRLNISHVGLKESEPHLYAYQQAARRAGVAPKLLVDIQGAELRVGNLDSSIHMEKGQTVTLGEGGVPIPEELLFAMEDGMEILLDDSAILLRAKSCFERFVLCVVLRPGILSSKKSIAVKGATVRMPVLTRHDRDNLVLASQYGVTGVLLPFCTSADDVQVLRSILLELSLSNNGCDPCIAMNLKREKIPVCLFKNVHDDISSVPDFTMAEFVKFYTEYRVNSVKKNQ